MRRIGLDGLDEIRDEIGTALQLNVDPAPALAREIALANEPKRFVRLARGSHNDLDNFGGIEIARNFINLAKG
jgi:hypothetical protein